MFGDILTFVIIPVEILYCIVLLHFSLDDLDQHLLIYEYSTVSVTIAAM